jgi:hypothetical protein
MRYLLFKLLFLLVLLVQGQDVSWGAQTTLHIGPSADLSIGGDVIFSNATLNNFGIIYSYGDVDFGSHTDVGNITFLGVGDQLLIGSTAPPLSVGDLTVDKTGKLILNAKITVTGNLNVTNGVVESNNVDDLIVTGGSDATGNGFVEGSLVGSTTGSPLTFPMGITAGNGTEFKNYITISSTKPGVVIHVECKPAVPATLLPDEDIVGIADEVEWILTAIGDSTDALITVNYSGVDLSNFSNGKPINANAYEAAIASYFKTDTLHHSLETSSRTVASDRTNGIIVSSQSVTISKQGTRFSVALIPVITEPTFFVPNSFAPASQIDENRLFRPFFAGAEISKVSMSVFNSLNQKVYGVDLSGTALDLTQIGWDGRLSSGTIASDGVYYFTVRLEAEGKIYEKAGGLLLVK